MILKQRIINRVISMEGGYVNNPDDSGGETNYGITEKVARDNGYDGSMKEMQYLVAFGIYCNQYWDSLRADDLVGLSEEIAEEVVDTGVHMGVKRAGEFLQRCLNVFNQGDMLYDPLIVDGVIGTNTLHALAICLDDRDTNTFMKALNCLQGAFYIELAERREKDKAFVYGWLRTRVGI